MTEADQEEFGAWYREQIENYSRVAPRYKELAKVLDEILTAVADRYAPLAIVQTRPKSLSSFAEKIIRKRAETSDPVNDFTDLCGGRVITHTQTEVTKICEYIEEHFDIDWDNSVNIDQRLKATEFGYRSVHYIVSLRPGSVTVGGVSIDVPTSVAKLKAEVQVRTLLEHAWADFSHDKSYKSAFAFPRQWQRELARIAAVLEDADQSFATIENRLTAYAANYSAYMSEAQVREEMRTLSMILEHDPHNVQHAHRIGRLAMTLGDWDRTIEIFTAHVDTGYAPLLKDLGVALCKRHSGAPESEAYVAGQRYLEASLKKVRDADTLVSLADTYRERREDRARELYRQAFELDPSDPYALINYLELEISYRSTTSIIDVVRPLMRMAIRRCWEQIAVGINIPWAYYALGMLHLLLGEEDENLIAYAKAIQMSAAEWPIAEAYHSLVKLAPVREALRGYRWARSILLIGWTGRFESPEARAYLEELTTPNGARIKEPVSIVAGGCDSPGETYTATYRGLMLEAFKDYAGTVISCGSSGGIGRLIGNVQEQYPELQTIGFLPRELPSGAPVDDRYCDIRRIDGNGFDASGPLQYWVDLIGSDVSPTSVKLLGVNGGSIARIEYRLALALRASVAVIAGSGHEAAKLIQDDQWSASETLIQLPNDPLSAQAYIGSTEQTLPTALRERMAQEIHDKYRQRRRLEQSQEPELAEWDELREHLKQSNRAQADDIAHKLKAVGYTIRKARTMPVTPAQFTHDEVEIMAELEHARWNVERLRAGWKWGAIKDVDKKESPFIIPWKELSEKTKEFDRDAVRDIPRLLAEFGMEIVRTPDNKRKPSRRKPVTA
ncbi:MAG TPA: RyR domain-containing protein [Candidatus Bathyarchaeia archaeon]|nr:RyR domain-containing protein [Candidatus Bathyarchaeia archaeon]